MAEKDHSPRWQYDCGRCKFNWNCGPLCSCVMKDRKAPLPPIERRQEVDALRAEWRKQRGIPEPKHSNWE